MKKNHKIQFWVAQDEFEKIKVNAKAKGFRTISDYLRCLGLEHDFEFKLKIEKIYSSIQEIQKKKTEKPKLDLNFDVPEWINYLDS